MKRHNVLLVLLAAFLIGAMAQAQQRTTNPQGVPEERFRLRELDLLNQVKAIVDPAWWNNTALVTRLGVTDDQKSRLERAYQNHRQDVASTTGLLEKEEAQLARLLEAEPLDRNAVLAQADRVIQARSEMERTNMAMTLEMREALTRDQWLQVPRNTWLPNITWQRVVGGRTGGPGLGGTAPVAPPSPPVPGQGGRRGGRGQ
ncbi:MAG: periplasmic heavy metal sensor [Acidobacteria bacterium]|nr:periplasmic heavy metal sensor [Acidobacteriota bacterium]